MSYLFHIGIKLSTQKNVILEFKAKKTGHRPEKVIRDFFFYSFAASRSGAGCARTLNAAKRPSCSRSGRFRKISSNAFSRFVNGSGASSPSNSAWVHPRTRAIRSIQFCVNCRVDFSSRQTCPCVVPRRRASSFWLMPYFFRIVFNLFMFRIVAFPPFLQNLQKWNNFLLDATV